MSRNKIAINEDWLVRVEELRDRSGAYIDSALLSWQIVDAQNGNVIGSGVLSSLGNGGNYEAVISDNVTGQLKEAGHYHLIVFGSDAGRNIYRLIELDPYYRGNE